jgi:hypothetical protein
VTLIYPVVAKDGVEAIEWRVGAQVGLHHHGEATGRALILVLKNTSERPIRAPCLTKKEAVPMIWFHLCLAMLEICSTSSPRPC